MPTQILKDIIILLTLSIVFFLFSYGSVYIEPDQKIENEVESFIQKNGKQIPPNEFKTDGCSLWPDSLFDYSWQDYCIEHDLKYWLGGTDDERLQADIELRDRINSVLPGMGDVVYVGVRAGGRNFIPIIPFPWGWGYGKNN